MVLAWQMLKLIGSKTAMPAKPSIDIILERLTQNTNLTREVKNEVEDGFKVLNVRISKNTEHIQALQLYREMDQQNLRDARAAAKRILEDAAEEARARIADEKPVIGSNKWLLVTLVSIILALIGAIGVSQ